MAELLSALVITPVILTVGACALVELFQEFAS